MREKLKNLNKKPLFGKFLFRIPHILYDFYRYRIMTDEQFIKATFRRELGYKLDLKSPKTFNEKIQWLKINDRTAKHTKCADKFAVREYVANRIGEEHLIPLLLHTKDVKDLVPENLPQIPFIVKATHFCGGNIIVRDKSQMNWKHIRHKADQWLKENYYYRLREWQYKNIPPALVVEKLLQDNAGKIPYDYKIHCFHGEIEFIQVHQDRESNHRKVIYDADWNLLKFSSYYEEGLAIPKPKTFDLMKKIARKLSAEFYYVRVDLYEVEDTVYFGELTFHHASGFRKFNPESQDRILGDKLKLPIDNHS